MKVITNEDAAFKAADSFILTFPNSAFNIAQEAQAGQCKGTGFTTTDIECQATAANQITVKFGPARPTGALVNTEFTVELLSIVNPSV